ncbi:MAG: glycosyltransferase [Bacteroidetes bacterium]|nr:glycosyltransferase [Bacteroidota bacterium]
MQMTTTPTRQFLFFGLTSFDSLPQREQALAMELAQRGHRVDFIEFPPTVPGRAVGMLQTLQASHERDRGFARPQHPENLFVHTPPTHLTGFRSSYTPALDRLRFRLWFRRRFASLDVSKTIAMVMLPLWWGYLIDGDLLHPRLLIYDICDALEVQGRTQRALVRLRRHEVLLATEADLITYSAHEMRSDIHARFPSRPALLLPNAVRSAFVQRVTCVGSRKQSHERQRIGYIGATHAGWFDLKLMRAVIDAFPQCDIDIVGPVTEEFTRLLPEAKHVYCHGFVHHHDLPALLCRFDVAIIPFLRNEITRVVNPLKLYEYASAGVPVVATDTDELRHYRDQLYLADTREEFLSLLSAALNENDERRRSQRRRFAEENTWAQRADVLLSHIAELTGSS